MFQIRFYCSTPASLSWRKYGEDKKKNGKRVQNDDLGIFTITLADQRRENVPRLSGRDLLDLLGLQTQYMSDGTDSDGHHFVTQRARPPVLPVDVRPLEEYKLGALADSLHLPETSWQEADVEAEGGGAQQLRPEVRDALTLARKGRIVCVVGGDGDCGDASSAAERLLALGYSRLCVLHNGLDAFKALPGALVVPDA